jgi:DNA modification methylase
MSKAWDSVKRENVYDFHKLWAVKVLRVMKPGAHILVFGAPRTYHRMTCAIEDAGFEIRDCLMWEFGSGFPKSLDVSKAIDKRRNDDVRPVCRFLRYAIESSGASVEGIARQFGFHSRMVDHWAARDTDSQPTIPTIDQWRRLKEILKFSDEMDCIVVELNERKGEYADAWKKAKVVGEYGGSLPGLVEYRFNSRDNFIREPVSKEAAQWQGWGTALKPAYEPIVLARKPLIGTVAQNILKHGTGGINVDGCRIRFASEEDKEGTGRLFQEWHTPPGDGVRHGKMKVLPGLHQNDVGRWPSNLLLDEESAKMLDEQSGERPTGELRAGLYEKGRVRGVAYGEYAPYRNEEYPPSTGGASRFFYIAKADRFEREAGLVGNVECSRCKKLVEEGQWPVHQGDHIYNDHPTVKPIELMRYLVRLVTPRNGLCLDPFVGSGTTLIADMFEGVNGIGIEKDAEKEGAIFHRLEYWKPIAERRKTEESQERKEQAHRIAETVRTLDTFESEKIEQEQDQLGDGK